VPAGGAEVAATEVAVGAFGVALGAVVGGTDVALGATVGGVVGATAGGAVAVGGAAAVAVAAATGVAVAVEAASPPQAASSGSSMAAPMNRLINRVCMFLMDDYVSSGVVPLRLARRAGSEQTIDSSTARPHLSKRRRLLA
jgi:hypothetical protein